MLKRGYVSSVGVRLRSSQTSMPPMAYKKETMFLGCLFIVGIISPSLVIGNGNNCRVEDFQPKENFDEDRVSHFLQYLITFFGIRFLFVSVNI